MSRTFSTRWLIPDGLTASVGGLVFVSAISASKDPSGNWYSRKWDPASDTQAGTIHARTVSRSILSGGERRSPFGLRRLERASRAQHAGVGVERANDLQADRQPGASQPAWDARGRLAGHVERVAERRPVDPMALGRRVIEILRRRQRRDRHHRRQQQIVFLMKCRHLLAERGADQVGAEIIYRAD